MEIKEGKPVYSRTYCAYKFFATKMTTNHNMNIMIVSYEKQIWWKNTVSRN